jgi:NAD-dependent dihydropyrimidine dehydrogenase PreA subunit
MSEETYMAVPRKKIPWYPTVDYKKCNFCDGDPQCLKFCPHGVYGIDESQKKLNVTNPNSCVVFCRSCRKVCAPDALSFPSKPEILSLIKNLRENTSP